MGRYLIRRALFMVLVLFVVSLLTFLIFVKLPAGDPARRAVGRTTTPEQIEAARKAFGLDKPLYVQYGRFAKGLIPWPGLFLDENVYYSYGNFVPVKEEIFRRLPVTVTLAVGAAILWLFIGIPIGIISGIKRGSFWDRAGMLFALIGVSMPVFWLGQLLLYFFWFKLEIAPSSGLEIGSNIWESIAQGKFILPWITLVGDVRRVLRADGPRQPDRDDERGLHPHRAGEGHAGAARHLQARAPRGAHAGGDDARSRPRRPAGRRVHHRDAVRSPRHRRRWRCRRSARRTSRRSWA